MGMFDTFIINDVCPTCGDTLDGIQSKSFICTLEKYSIGDEIQFDGYLIVDSGYIIEYNYCSCSARTKLFIRNGLFDGYSLLPDTTGD